MVVPGTMPPAESETVCPTASVPDETAVTVKIVPEMEPEKEAEGVLIDPTLIETICTQDPNKEMGR